MNLDAFLRDRSISRSEFARRVGVSPSAVSGWLNDPTRGPSRATLAKIETETDGLVTARDFAPREDNVPLLAGAERHDAASVAEFHMKAGDAA